jgi:hypothetical protein
MIHLTIAAYVSCAALITQCAAVVQEHQNNNKRGLTVLQHRDSSVENIFTSVYTYTSIDLQWMELIAYSVLQCNACKRFYFLSVTFAVCWSVLLVFPRNYEHLYCHCCCRQLLPTAADCFLC